MSTKSGELHLGAKKKEKSFALTIKEESYKWENKDITPLEYSLTKSENEHEIVIKVIRKWASQICQLPESIITKEMQPLVDYEKEIKDLANKENLNINEIDDYLKIIFKETAKTKLFFSHVKTESILIWLEKNNYLSYLFNPHYKLSDRDKIIAEWIGSNFVKQKPNLIFKILHNHDNTINPEFWNIILWHLSSKDDPPKPEILANWIILLLDSAPSFYASYERLEFLLIRCRYPEDKYTAYRLFEYLTTPIRKTEPTFSLTDKEDEEKTIDSRVSLRGHDYYLRESWAEYFKPNLDEFSRDIKCIVTNHLKKAYKMNIQFGHAGEKFDSESWFRSAIEKHEQDEHYRKMDVLIDAARDTLEYLLDNNHEQGKRLREEWSETNAPLLKRIAIHGYAYDKDTTPEQKLEFILNSNLLYAIPYKHEVFQIIKIAFKNASDEMQNKVIKSTLAGPTRKNKDKEDKKLNNYEIFNLLYWIYSNAPNSNIAKTAYEEYHNRYPDFIGREYPDFDHWTSGVIAVQHESPYSIEYFLNMPLDKTLSKILSFVGSKHYEGPDRAGMLNVLSNAVINSFDWSIELSNKLISIKEWKEDVWTAVIQGWEKSKHKEPGWLKIFEILSIFIKENGHIDAIGNLLETGIKNIDGGITVEIITDAENLSSLYWESLQTIEREERDDFGWLAEAINNPAGKTAEFWLQALSKRRQYGSEEWKGLPEEYIKRFNDILDSSSYSSQIARIILTSRFNFLYDIDKEWSYSNLLPLFDWDRDTHQAEQAWHGFVMWGRIPVPLREEFYPLLISTAKNLKSNRSEIREVFFKHVVAHAIYDTPQDLRNSWFYKIIEIITPEERKLIVHLIVSTLWDLKDEDKILIWNRFLKPYWKDRIDNIPVILDTAEANEFILLLLRLEIVFSEVVELIRQTNNLDLSQSHLYYDLNRINLDEKNPEQINSLLIHLLSYTEGQFIYEREITELYNKLVKRLSPKQLEPLREKMLSLGCLNL